MFPVGGWPEWAFADMWAPEVHYVGDKFIVYFSARKREDNQLAIGAAFSTEYAGPYDYLKSPLVDEYPGVIDVHYYRDPK